LASATKPKTANDNIRSAAASMPGELAATQPQRSDRVRTKNRDTGRASSPHAPASAGARSRPPRACQGRDL